MCSTCGCGQPDDHVKIIVPGDKEYKGSPDINHAHEHVHSHDHHHEHDHSRDQSNRQITLEQDVLHKNNLLAERNRGFLEAKNILALNLVSSPGSGKTTFLEKTIQLFSGGPEIAIIEGDQQTSNDADRIAATGVKVVQINTGKGCHLDAHMVLHAIQKLEPGNNSILMIENVGNLICPSMFDLGERIRIVIMSITEGEDKPLKYPDMFMTSQICIINKIDLLPYLEFDLKKARDYALRINPDLKFFEVSASTGKGMKAWISWLKERSQ
jgi:hydrogenase nickel incorporation protein HypB